MVLRGSVYSNTLNMETGLSVITPNDYGQTNRYRVCYVLHGLCGGNGDYSNYTMLPYFAYDKDILFKYESSWNAIVEIQCDGAYRRGIMDGFRLFRMFEREDERRKAHAERSRAF